MGIGPSMDMPVQSFLSDTINERIETEIGLAVEVDIVPTHENGRSLPKLIVFKAETTVLNSVRIDRTTKDVWFVLGIGDPTSLRTKKDCVTPRLEVESESVGINLRGACLETPVVVFVEIDVVDEDDHLGRGGEWARKVNTRGGFQIRVAPVLASQYLQIGRRKIERVGNAAEINGVIPRGDMVDSGIFRDILYLRFSTDVGAVAYIELADPNGKTGRGDIWTREIDLSEGVKLRFGHRTDGLGVKLANVQVRHCVIARFAKDVKLGRRVVHPGLLYSCTMVIWIEFWKMPTKISLSAPFHVRVIPGTTV